MQSLIRHFVANFVLFQKHEGGFSKFFLTDATAATSDVTLMC